MSPIAMFLISIGISILVGVLISLYLRKPLFTLLVDVCGTQDRARFWLQVTILSYLLVAAAIGLNYRPALEYSSFFDNTEYGVMAANQGVLIFSLGRHLGRTLLGMLFTTGFMTFIISRFIRRQQKAEALAAGGK